MVRYADDIVKRISKGLISKDIFLHINNVFTAVDITKDLNLFDIKQLEMINFLSDYYERDRSSLIKYSLNELYEDIVDKRIVDEYEAKEKSGEAKFVDSKDILDMLEN